MWGSQRTVCGPLTFYLHREVLPFRAHATTVDRAVQGLRTAHGQGVRVPQTGRLMPLAATNLHAILEPRHRSHRGCGQRGGQDDIFVFPDYQRLLPSRSFQG